MFFSGNRKSTPFPCNAVQAVGEYWLFLSPSNKFGCGFEAEGIRVNPNPVHLFAKIINYLVVI
jgi:hypothetical protein